MAKSEKDQLIDNITAIVLLILSPPVFIYTAVVMAVALWPTVKLIYTFIACMCVMLGTMLELLSQMGPVLFIFAIPLALMFLQDYGGGGRR